MTVSCNAYRPSEFFSRQCVAWRSRRALVLMVCWLTVIPGVSSIAFGQSGGQESHNWPTFRGPNGDGRAYESARPPVEFGPESHLKWKVAIPGHGHSSPIVWEDCIYLMTAVLVDAAPSKIESGSAEERGSRRGMSGMNNPAPKSNYDFIVLCLNRETGETLWSKTVTQSVPHEGGHKTNTYASASPVTDGKHLWCNFGSQGVWCLDMEGNVVWNLDLGQMVTRNQFGEGASMAVHHNIAVIPWDQEKDSFILAVHALTGEELWRKPREEVTSWATPLVVEHDGKYQVVTNGARIRSYDLQSGDLIWECSGQTANPIPTPMVWQDNAICMTGYRGYSIQSIRLSASGDVTDSDYIQWKRSDSAPYVASPAMVDDTIYLVKGNSGVLSSVSAVDGSSIMDAVRLPGVDQMYASLVSAGGHVYACGRSGEIVVFEHAKDFRTVHHVNLGEPIDATPAISGTKLLIRSHQHLYCFE